MAWRSKRGKPTSVLIIITGGSNTDLYFDTKYNLDISIPKNFGFVCTLFKTNIKCTHELERQIKTKFFNSIINKFLVNKKLQHLTAWTTLEVISSRWKLSDSKEQKLHNFTLIIWSILVFITQSLTSWLAWFFTNYS